MIVKLPQQAASKALRPRIAFVHLSPDGEADAPTPRLECNVESISLGADWGRSRLDDVDGLIVIGSGLDGVDVEAIPFWQDLTALFDRAASRSLPALYIGWASQAVLCHRHGICPSPLATPVVGVVEQEILAPSSSYLSGLGRRAPLFVERLSKIRWASLAEARVLRALATGSRTGLSIIEEPATRSLMVLDRLDLNAEPQSVDGRILRNWLTDAITRRCPEAA